MNKALDYKSSATLNYKDITSLTRMMIWYQLQHLREHLLKGGKEFERSKLCADLQGGCKGMFFLWNSLTDRMHQDIQDKERLEGLSLVYFSSDIEKPEKTFFFRETACFAESDHVRVTVVSVWAETLEGALKIIDRRCCSKKDSWECEFLFEEKAP